MGNSLIDRGACAGSEDAVKVSVANTRQLVIPSPELLLHLHSVREKEAFAFPRCFLLFS